MRQSELDRRTFVMGSFGFGMAVLGGGMLAGCVAAEEQVEENEAPAPDEEGGPAESVASEPEPAAHGGRALVAVFSYSGNTFFRRRAHRGGDGCRPVPHRDDRRLSRRLRCHDFPGAARTRRGLPAADRGRGAGLGCLRCGLPGQSHLVGAVAACDALVSAAARPGGQGGRAVLHERRQPALDGALADIRDLCPGANLLDGLTVERNALPDALDQVAPWIEGLGLA